MSFLGEKYLLHSETALAIYEAIKGLPVVDPHNHADVKEIAGNCNYPNLWQLLAATDHYVWSVMRKRSITEEYITGTRPPKEKWLKLAGIFPLLIGNPIYEWAHLDLRRYLGIKETIGADTAEKIWDKANEVLAQPRQRPQQLLEEIGVEVMCSTDDPVDRLAEHDEVNRCVGRMLIRPTWRPDKAMKIGGCGWREYMAVVENRFNLKLHSVGDLLEAMRLSHDYFAEHGCVISDHGVETPLSGKVSEKQADEIFRNAMAGKAVSPVEAEAFMSYFFGAVAELDVSKGWVFQIHMGAARDARNVLSDNLGPDTGGDVSNHFIDPLPPLKSFLNRFEDRLKVVLYCLDPGHQATLATMSRAFGAKVNLGSAWWFNDNPIGMRRQLEYIGSVDLWSNFAGMVSDSRKLLSYGSRFEMFRRVLSDVLAEMVIMGQAPYKETEQLAVYLSYRRPKEFFGL